MYLIFFVLMIIINDFGICKIPNYVKICSNKENDLSKCVQESIELLRPYLIKGIPEMGIPSLEPLLIPNLSLNQTEPAFKINLKTWNTSSFGASNFQLRYLKLSLNDMIGQYGIVLPEIQFITNYNINAVAGNIIPINGIGILKGNISNIRADINAHGEWRNNKISSNSSPYLQIDNLVSRIKIGDLNFKIENPNHSTELINAIETFYFENRRAILNMISPLIENITNQITINILNSILKKFTKDEILPI